MSTMTPQPQPPGGMPPKKKTSPWVWVLVAVVGVFVLFGLLLVAGGLFVFHKAKQAGLDPDLMRRNPALAVTKMLATVNPDVEVLRVDEKRGLITLRDKKTGKTTTVDFEDVKRGKIVFEGEGGEKVTVETSGEGETGTVRLKSSEGVVEFGKEVGKTPDWVPSYPGSKPEGTFSARGEQGESGTFHFTTSDTPAKVIAFYDGALKRGGMKVSSSSYQEDGKIAGGMVSGTDEATDRSVTVLVGSQEGGASVNVTFGKNQ